MKALILVGALVLLATPAFAVPMCDQPIRDSSGMANYGFGPETEDQAALQFEQELNSKGIKAHQTRFWNGCLQTWVAVDGQDQMRFYDPDTLSELH